MRWVPFSAMWLQTPVLQKQDYVARQAMHNHHCLERPLPNTGCLVNLRTPDPNVDSFVIIESNFWWKRSYTENKWKSNSGYCLPEILGISSLQLCCWWNFLVALFCCILCCLVPFADNNFVSPRIVELPLLSFGHIPLCAMCCVQFNILILADTVELLLLFLIFSIHSCCCWIFLMAPFAIIRFTGTTHLA